MGIAHEVAGAAGSRRFALIWPVAVISLAVVAIFGVLVSALDRGGWQDEYATFYFADPTIPFQQAWLHVWSNDPNPPFFYMVARLWQLFVGNSLFAHRLINLLPLCFLVAWLVTTARRRPDHRSFLTVMAMFAFSSQFFLLYFPDYRSYFFQYCTELVFLGAASIGYLDRDRRPNVFQLVALPFLILLHQVTALYAGVLLLPLLLIDIRRHFYMRAVCLVAVAAVAMIALGLFTWLQLHQFDLTDMRWIPPQGPVSALELILSNLMLAVGNNWGAICVAGAVVFLPHYRPHAPAVSLIGLIAGAAFVATFFVLIINQHAPLIVERYFTFLAVEVIVILSLAIAPVLSIQPWLAALVTASAALFVVQSSIDVAHQRGWLGDADIVAKLVAQCPETRIHAGSRAPGSGPDPALRVGPEQGEQIGLANIAKIDHLTLLPLAPDSPGVCPVIYWTMYRAPSAQRIAEHHGDIVSAANDSAGFGLNAAALAHTRAIQTGDTGIILVVSKATGGPADK